MSSGVRRSSSNISAWLETRASLPSPRSKVGSPSPPSTIPAAARIARTCAGSSSWFLALKASIDGAMMRTLPSSRPSHTNASRENT